MDLFLFLAVAYCRSKRPRMNREKMIPAVLKPASEISFVILVLAYATAAETPPQSMALPGYPSTCGNLTDIPYPFGIGPGCFLAPRYEIDCQQIRNISTPVLKNLSVVVLNISLSNSSDSPRLIKVSQPIFYSHSDCTTNQQKEPPVDLVDSNGAFFYSRSQNYFVAGGCDSPALMVSAEAVVGCKSSCKSESSRCFNGTTCCLALIPDGIANYSVEFRALNGKAIAIGDAECSYGFLVERAWWSNVDFHSLLPKAVLVVLEWGIAFDETKLVNRSHNDNSGSCLSNSWTPMHCYCIKGYEGNYYLPQGCQDVDECEENYYSCEGKCVNRPGSYHCRHDLTIQRIDTSLPAPFFSYVYTNFVCVKPKNITI